MKSTATDTALERFVEAARKAAGDHDRSQGHPASMGVCRRPLAHWQQPSCQAEPPFTASAAHDEADLHLRLRRWLGTPAHPDQTSRRQSKLSLSAIHRREHAAPPEDCGGIPGFYSQLEILRDPKHPDHEDVKDWFPDYDPNSPSRTGSPASQTVAEQRPPGPSGGNQLTLMPKSPSSSFQSPHPIGCGNSNATLLSSEAWMRSPAPLPLGESGASLVKGRLRVAGRLASIKQIAVERGGLLGFPRRCPDRPARPPG